MARFPATEHHPARLSKLEDSIGKARKSYLRAVWAGHDGEADFWETEVDRLLSEWQAIRHHLIRPAR